MDRETSIRSRERQRVVSSRGHLPRLAPEYYRGHATVHWTPTIDQRATGWLTPSFHTTWREVLLHTCARYDLLCPVYVLMPDHAHLMLMGLDEAGSDQRTAIAFLRKHTRAALTPHDWQKQAYDHVLRSEERRQRAFAKVCCYIMENPVRTGLCKAPVEWPFFGCVVPGYPEFDPLADDYWPRFWRCYRYLIESRPST